jgi:hypothetical protein
MLSNQYVKQGDKAYISALAVPGAATGSAVSGVDVKYICTKMTLF